MHSFSLSLLATAMTVTAGLAAQATDSPAPQHPLDTSAALRGLSGVQETDDGIQGRGEAYRIGFSADGAELTPYFGAAADQPYPVRLRLASVRRSTGDAWQVPATPTPQLADDTVTFRHDAERLGRIEERYTVRPEGTELSVLLPRPLRGSGDLTVRVHLETALRTDEVQRAASLTLGDGPFGHVTVGAVTGIDAAGRRIAGWLNLDARGLEMVLPADFVDTASWPVLVDPLIGSTVNAGRSTVDVQADVAAIPSLGQYMVVFTSATFQNRGDIWGVRLDANTGSRVAVDLLDLAGGVFDREQPAVASYVDGPRTLVTTAYRSNVLSSTDRITLATWDSSTQTVTNRRDLNVSGQTPGAPDIGIARPDGVQRTTGTILVAYADDESNPTGIVIDQIGPGGGPSRRVLPVQGPVRNVAISKSGGDTGNFIVCWDENRFGLIQRVFFRTADVAGNVGPEWRINASVFPDTFDPEVAVDESAANALLVFSMPEPNDPTRADVIGCQFPLANIGTAYCFPIEDEPGDDESRAAVTYFGNGMFGVLWNEEISSTGLRQIQGVNVLRGESGRCGREWTANAGSGTNAGTPKAASMADAGGTPDQGMFVWESTNQSGDRQVFARRFEGYGPGGSVRDLGGACGLGGTLTAHGGPFAFGNRDFRLELTGANNGTPTAATMLVKLGNNPGFFRCGSGCALLLQDFDVGFGVSGNVTTFPLPVTCNPNFFDRTVVLQALVLTPAVNPCGLAPASVSNSMSVTIRD